MRIAEEFRRRLQLGRAVRLVWEAGPGRTVASGLLVLLQGVLPLLSLYLIKMIIDAVNAGAKGADVRAHVFVLVGIAGGIALLGAILRPLAAFVAESQAQHVTDRMQEMLHQRSVAADLEYYENPSFYDTLHRAQEEAPYRPTRVVNSLMGIGQNAISLVAVAGLLLFVLPPPFLLILLAAAVPGLLVKLRFTKTLFHLRRLQTAAEREGMFLSWMLTGEHYAKEIRLFGLGEFLIGRAQACRRELRRQKIRIAGRRAISEAVTQACATAAIFGCFGFLAWRTLAGALSVGTMVLYYQAFQRGQSAFQDLLAGLTDLYENNLFLANVYEFLDLAPRIASPARPEAVPAPIRRGIVFEGVGFEYGGGRKVLEDIDFTVHPGETVALVGENGSGKTTLIKLLCRLYDPSRGRILVDGVDLRRMAVADWRRAVSVVFQDYAHYPMTARENVWLGDVALSPTDERVEVAARRSGAHDAISPLERGYDTMLGNTFNGGAELSIGQWQKVALARAFVREAQIIVLDEPSSALDAQAECEVFERFRELAHGRTALLISHRLSTVKMADRICVLGGGRITESGTHAELIALGGAYAQMYRLQAGQYAS